MEPELILPWLPQAVVSALLGNPLQDAVERLNLPFDILVTGEDYGGFIQGREELALRAVATKAQRPTKTHHPAEHITL